MSVAPGHGLLTVIGTAALDRRIQTPRLPRAGELLVARQDGENAGGAAANTAARAAALGVPVHLICRLGADWAGERVRAALSEMPGLTVDAQAGDATAVAEVLITPDGQRTILFCAPASSPDPRPTKHSLRRVGGGAVTWIDVRDCEWRSGFHRAAAGTLRGLPAQYLGGELEEGRRWELALGSVDEFPVPPDERLLAGCGVRLCVITEGAQGGRCWTADDGWRRFGAEPSERVVDTTGAGDAFAGGLLGALALGWPLARALRAAAVSGARAVEEAGAWPSGRTLEFMAHAFE
jgi:ribokinase